MEKILASQLTNKSGTAQSSSFFLSIQRIHPMRRLVLSLALGLAAPAMATAQQHDADSSRTAVMAVVKQLFDGMRKGDSAMVRSAFYSQNQLASLGARAGAPMVNFDSLAQFARAVGTPHPEMWDERTHDETVHIDGGMAAVWAPYEFYLGTKFSHCGVDNFQLARTSDGWKIIALVDTRQRTACPGH
jgi:hypothetical protein